MNAALPISASTDASCMLRCPVNGLAQVDIRLIAHVMPVAALVGVWRTLGRVFRRRVPGRIGLLWCAQDSVVAGDLLLLLLLFLLLLLLLLTKVENFHLPVRLLLCSLVHQSVGRIMRLVWARQSIDVHLLLVVPAMRESSGVVVVAQWPSAASAAMGLMGELMGRGSSGSWRHPLVPVLVLLLNMPRAQLVVRPVGRHWHASARWTA